MRATLLRRLGTWWWLLLISLAVLLVLLARMEKARDPVSELTPANPISVHSTVWRVGADVDLTLVGDPSLARQTISVTILSPGSGVLQIEGRGSEFFGISGVQIPWLGSEHREIEVALAAAVGPAAIGLDFDWRRIEPDAGRFVWQDTDHAVSLAKQYDLRLVPMLLYTPRWASTASHAPLDYQHAPPVDYTIYQDFGHAVVERYKPFGNSPLTEDGYGITDWVIWNEPNVRSRGEDPEPSGFWLGSLEEYVLLLRAGYEAAHAADPGCNVLNAGLADVSYEYSDPYLATALERLYDPNGDGDAGDGARPFFDTLNVHTYQTGAPDAVWYEKRLEGVVAVMERFGDARKGIWITETGYGSTSADDLPARYVDEQSQADSVRLVYEVTAAYPQVERVFWWSLRDYYQNSSSTNPEMEAHYGLLHANFQPKPAYLSYGRLTGRLGRILHLSGLPNDAGTALVTVPASFVSRPGLYVVLAASDAMMPPSAAFFEVPAPEGNTD
jgi:hypothetical protein